jgi:hypothetical protein
MGIAPRPGPLPANGQPGDPSLATLLTLAVGVVAMAGVAISPRLRARLILLRPIPLHQRLLIHLAHQRRRLRRSGTRLVTRLTA